MWPCSVMVRARDSWLKGHKLVIRQSYRNKKCCKSSQGALKCGLCSYVIIWLHLYEININEPQHIMTFFHWKLIIYLQPISSISKQNSNGAIRPVPFAKPSEIVKLGICFLLFLCISSKSIIKFSTKTTLAMHKITRSSASGEGPRNALC